MKRFVWFCVFLLGEILGLRNLNVDRLIDLNSQVVRVEHKVVLDVPSTEYSFIIHPSDVPHIAFVNVHNRNNGNSLKITGGMGEYTIVSEKKTKFSEFIVTTVLIHALSPKPTEIYQGDTQFMKYSGSIHYYSIYETNQEETTIRLPSGQLLQYTDSDAPVSKKDRTLIYGPYKEVKSKSFKTCDIHFEFRSPALTTTKMTRLIEISHWGNIAVEETLEVINSGSKLRGAFSRLDFDMNPGKTNAVSAYKTALPAAAKDIYYRDAIGNISTSSVKDLRDSVEVTIQPRFPLMGGWKTEYILGYNVPAHQFLYRNGDRFSLRMRFLDHVYDEQVVDELTVKIMLPELVSDIQFSAPYSTERLPDEVMKTYLDTAGRTVLVFEKKNLVNEHIQEFELNYRFNMLLMVREPAMLVTAFLVIFAVVLVYVRLDFSILSDDKADLRLRVQTMVEDVQDVYKRRANIYQAYEDMLSGFRSSKDSPELGKMRRNIEAEHKSVNKSLSQLQSKIGDLYSDGAEKLAELITLDSTYRDLVQESIQLCERLVNGKVTKQQYQSSDIELCGKKANLVDIMDSIVEGL